MARKSILKRFMIASIITACLSTTYFAAEAAPHKKGYYPYPQQQQSQQNNRQATQRPRPSSPRPTMQQPRHTSPRPAVQHQRHTSQRQTVQQPRHNSPRPNRFSTSGGTAAETYNSAPGDATIKTEFCEFNNATAEKYFYAATDAAE